MSTSPVAGLGETRRLLGLDVGGSSVKAALMIERDGLHPQQIVATTIRTLPSTRRPQEVVGEVAAAAHTLIEEHGFVHRIGLGLPGLHDEDSGEATLLPNFPKQWHGYPVRREVAALVGQTPTLVNDARAFTLAESLIGAAAGFRTVVCVVLGTGVGGGVVHDGALWRGAGTAGEIGHQTIDIGGPPCGCGNHGCVEALASSAALLAGSAQASVLEVFEAAAAGDRRARSAVDRAVEAVGTGLANAYSLVAPDAFVVGGGIAAAGDWLLDAIEAVIRRRVRVAEASAIRVLPATLGRYAGAVGAALYASR